MLHPESFGPRKAKGFSSGENAARGASQLLQTTTGRRETGPPGASGNTLRLELVRRDPVYPLESVLGLPGSAGDVLRPSG
jgi:hypothetical protein